MEATVKKKADDDSYYQESVDDGPPPEPIKLPIEELPEDSYYVPSEELSAREKAKETEGKANVLINTA